MPNFKVSPAAAWWLRSYAVLPSQVPATGPKGYIVKGDVLKHIKTNNLSLRPREAPVAPAKQPKQQKAAPKKAAKKPAGQSAASPIFNPDDPFQ